MYKKIFIWQNAPPESDLFFPEKSCIIVAETFINGIIMTQNENYTNELNRLLGFMENTLGREMPTPRCSP